MKKLMITLMFFCVSILDAQIPRYALDLEGVPQFEPPIENISYVVRDLKILAGMPMTHQAAFVVTDSLGRIELYSSSKLNPSIPVGGALYQPLRVQPDNSITVTFIVFDNNGDIGVANMFRLSDTLTPINTLGSFDIHSYVEDPSGNGYIARQHVIDDVDYSSVGSPTDTSVQLLTHTLIKFDPNGGIVYEYTFDDQDLFDRIPFDIVLEGDQTDEGTAYDVTHPNYASFAEDTNYIIFSNRNPVQPDLGQGWTGIGAIDMRTDSLQWIGWGHEIALDQPVDIVMQHDFKLIEHGPYAGYYSVYNNGDSISGLFNQHSSVLVLDIDFDVDSAWLIDQIHFPSIFSESMGNVIYEEDRILVNHGGTYAIFSGEPQINVTIHDYSGALLSEHSLPDGVFSYNIESAPYLNKQSNFDCESGEAVGTPPFVWSNGDTGSVVSNIDSGYVISEHISGFMREVLYFDCEREDTTSVTSEVVKKSLSIYPNPTNGAIFVKNFQNNQPYVMYDIAGKVVQEGTLQNQINISSLNSGMYILETKNVQHKIVVQ